MIIYHQIRDGLSIPKFLGFFRGTVANDQDPENRGRLQLNCPFVYGDQISNWALPMGMHAGQDEGKFDVPRIGSTVWITFESGDVNYPIWIHGWSPAFSPQGTSSGSNNQPGGISGLSLATAKTYDASRITKESGTLSGWPGGETPSNISLPPLPSLSSTTSVLPTSLTSPSIPGLQAATNLNIPGQLAAIQNVPTSLFPNANTTPNISGLPAIPSLPSLPSTAALPNLLPPLPSIVTEALSIFGVPNAPNIFSEFLNPGTSTFGAPSNPSFIPNEAKVSYTKVKIVAKSRKKHVILMDDTDGKEAIIIRTGDASVSVIWDQANKKYVVSGSNVILNSQNIQLGGDSANDQLARKSDVEKIHTLLTDLISKYNSHTHQYLPGSGALTPTQAPAQQENNTASPTYSPCATST